MSSISISQNEKPSIGLLGCGWLGIALAQKLQKLGFDVRGSRTTTIGIAELQNKNIPAHQLLLSESGITGDLRFFDGIDVLVLCLPPGLRKNPSASFVCKIEALIPELQQYPIHHLVYMSSIGVYGSVTGKVDESVPPKPSTQSGKQILAVERLLLKHFPKQTTIGRLGGLIGDERHPLHALLQKDCFPNGNHPINLIHQDDAVNAFVKLIQRPFENSIVNLVSPYHPSKKEYYTAIAKQWHCNTPNFSLSQRSGKYICSQLLTAHYGFDFEVEKLLIE